MNEFLEDAYDDLDFLLDEFGRPATIDSVEIEKVLIDDEGQGVDENRSNVNVRVQSLIVKEVDMSRPKSGQELNINGDVWVVTKTDSLEGVMSVQVFKELS